MELKKVVLIFGGGGSLGKKIAEKLILKSCKIIAADKFYKGFKKINENYFTAGLDVTNKKAMIALKKNILKKFGRIDDIIFAITYKTKDFYYSFDKLSLQSWKKIIDTELTGAFLVGQIFGGYFENKNKGNLVFVSSIYGVVGNDHSIYRGSNLAEVYSNKKQKKNVFSNSAYSTAKGGLISFMKFLSTYWAGKNIRVNCCSPGGIHNVRENKSFIKKYNLKVPLRRKGKVEEIADAIIFLISKESSYINGHNLIVDGGFTAW